VTAARPPAVLVADDQPDVVQALRLLLRREGFDTVEASSPAGVLATARARELDAALLDLNYARDTTSGREGLDLLAELAALDPSLPVVVMTAWGTVEGAVEAMRRGARDYVQKPWDNARLVTTLRTQVELRQALRRGRLLSAEASRGREQAAQPLVAESRAMQEVLRVLERVAPSDANVLVTGEHGTGKEVVARRLHALSRRADRPLVVVNAGALSEGLLESELFGHVKGAFTDARADRVGCFELADQGTLFLDEIGTMPLGQQAKLLRVLQTGELAPVGSSRVRRVDVRVVSATNADLPALGAAGAFRQDLLYRLDTVEIRVPPLRERREDVPVLAQLFLARHAARYGRPGARLAPAAVEALLAHPWPGNVRELEHAVERAALLARSDELAVEDLGLRVPAAAGPAWEDLTLEEAERLLVQRALARAGGHVPEAARRLGVSRSALYRRLQALGLEVPRR
jgi:DNA-binding NtrC family response regulator